MLTRLTHAAIAFAVTAVLYQAYVLAVAPFIEPPPTVSFAETVGAEGGYADGAAALDKYRELLAAYFPPDHWCFARPPKTLESESRQVLAIFDGDEQAPNGVLTLPHCAVLFFPRPSDRAAGPPRNAIILEASGGAVLQMEAEGKNNTGFGRLQNGQLLGEVTVRSDMNDAGPQDDLRLVTRDIYINEDLIHTSQTVDLQLGQHRAFGRELELRWLKTTGGADSPMGLYGAFDDLVIKHDVSLILAPGELAFSGQAQEASESVATGASPAPVEPPVAKAFSPRSQQPADSPAPPVRIKCAGNFRIDFGGYKASFSDDVRAWQLQGDGTSDELQARELNLYFAKTTAWNDGGGAPTTVAGGMSFEPASVEALGESSKPVILHAPSFQASARGERLWIELINRSVRSVMLSGAEEVWLAHRGSQIFARSLLQYTMPPAGSNQVIGTLVASGKGRLQAVTDPAQPSNVLEVSWGQKMQIIRRNGQPVVILDGRPQVSMVGAGRMWADQLQLFLRELPDAAVAPASSGTAVTSRSVVPESITASGRVALRAPELSGDVNQLHINIEQTATTAASPIGQPAASGAASTLPGALGPGSLIAAGGGSGRRYDIKGIELNVDVAMRDRHAQVRGLQVDGSVVFEELPDTPGEAPPLRVAAEHVKVTGADTPNSQIEIRGGGGQNGVPQQMAEIAARGATLRAPLLTINRGTNQASIDYPGQVQLLVDRDMAGNPLPTPTPMDVTWQESMKLDGRRLTFLGDVFVQHASGWLRTRELVLQTTQPLRFDGYAGNQQPQLDQIECRQGAVAEFQQQDISGVTSRQHVEVQSIIVNQTTGEISGSGRGQIDSVHLAKGAGQLLAMPPGGPQAPGLVQTEQELRHLHIDFVRGVSGNLRNKSVNVHGDVRAVYGPVQTWDDRLRMAPGGAPGRDEVWITSDSLGVTESPMARLNNPQTRMVELLAEGKVTIEGQAAGQGMFTAYGHRAKYDQSKGNFILEGNGSIPATIEQQPYPGGPTSPNSAQRMTFNHVTGHLKIEGLEQGQFDQMQP